MKTRWLAWCSLLLVVVLWTRPGLDTAAQIWWDVTSRVAWGSSFL